MSELAGEFKDFGRADLYTSDKTVSYKFHSEEQSKLYSESRVADLDLYYFFAGSVIRLAIYLGFLIIGYPLSYYFFSNTNKVNKIFKYLFIGWLIWVAYFLYKDKQLENKAKNLAERVKNEIPHTTTYK